MPSIKPEDLVGQCECADPLCVCRQTKLGRPCLGVPFSIGYRVDMDDATGTKFCRNCGQDALDAGLYRMEFANDHCDETLTADNVPCIYCGTVDRASTVNSPTCEACWLASK